MVKPLAHLTRRQALILLLFLANRSWAKATNLIAIKAARLWPAVEYTRLTFEQTADISYQFFLLNNPQRLVIDLENVSLETLVKHLPAKTPDNDPYIRNIRAGQFTANVVRLVVELKEEVRPNIFSLKPVDPYGYRLVVDLYPAIEQDPLQAFLNSLPEGKSTPPSSEPSESLKSGKMLTVVIDPGHGGEDSGAIGKNGTMEKNVVLAISRELKAIIDASANMRAALTRNGDYFIPLGERVKKARALKADLFISIHADAFVRRDVDGSSVFVLSEHGASSTAARLLAAKENSSDLIGGVSLNAGKDPALARTLLDLSQSQTIAESHKVASQVLNSLGKINPLHRGQVERAAFAVLKSPEFPSMLVETAFISNPEEEKKLQTPAFQKTLAQAIFAGINPHLRSQLAQS